MIAAWQTGDREQIAAALMVVVRRLVEFTDVPSGLDREDLTQEATIDTLRRLAKYDPSKGTIRTYVYGSVRFTVQDRSRQERRRASKFVQNDEVIAGASSATPRPSSWSKSPRRPSSKPEALAVA